MESSSESIWNKFVSSLKSGGWFLLGVGGFLLILFLFALFIHTVVSVYVNYVSGIVDVINPWVFLLSLALLFLCIFRKCRTWAGTLLVLCSYLIGVVLWLNSLVNTYSVFGGTGVFVGVVLLGIGIFFTSLAASLWTHAWLNFAWLLGIGIYVYTIRYIGTSLTEKETKRREDAEYEEEFFEPEVEESPQQRLSDTTEQQTTEGLRNASLYSFIHSHHPPQETHFGKLFVGFVKNDNDFTYEAHLINLANIDFARVVTVTGATASDDDRVLNMTPSKPREWGPLPRQSSMLLEEGPRTELDWVIWYHLDVYPDGHTDPLRLKFNLPKGHWEYKPTYLFIPPKSGMWIELAQRGPDEPLENK